ncbi:hypothetical protein [Ahniella affigens]|nr:hypothetical protein [Ahniella affigens]
MKRKVLLIALLAMAEASQAAPLVLSPGVLVDTETGLAFAANRNGFTQQLQLSDGTSIWTSPEQAFPLGVADGFLVALARAEAPGSANVLLMDPNTGNVADRISVDLPEPVSASFFPQPGQRFEATLQDTEEGMRFYWRHEVRALRGAAMVELDAGGNEVINPVTVTSGAFDLVAHQNRQLAIPVRADVAPPVAPTIALQGAERIPGIAGEQYRAADDRHVLSPEAKPHDALRQIYTWSVYDRDGNRVGHYTSPYARAPYLVRNSQLILREQPFAHAGTNGQWQEHSTRLVVADLQTGRELWDFEILDHQYRGPTPP